MKNLIPIRRALVSVSDKTGLVDFSKVLASFKTQIISTGGTLKALKEAGLPAISITDVTGFPEILDGRVKTLHPKIHGGLLYLRENEKHSDTVKKEGIEPIDLVCVNLYPFEKTVEKVGVTLEEAIENIDIGGPSMLRSGAKNYQSVVVISDPSDYAELIEELNRNEGKISVETSKKLAVKVFAKTHQYDGAIARFLKDKLAGENPEGALPESFAFGMRKKAGLRYGENPHQAASLYEPCGGVKVKFDQLHGKELSFNNLMDLDAALDILDEFRDSPTACVIKHNNPCGIGSSDNLPDALSKAIDSDPLSSFGGIVGLNGICDEKTVKVLTSKLGFIEIVLAPDFTSEALAELQKKKNLRILKIKEPKTSSGQNYQFRFTRLGVLVQDQDAPISLTVKDIKSEWKVPTKKQLEEKDWEELLFAWKCSKLVKSNAIVLTKDKGTVGIGAGQMSRVDSVRISCEKAGEKTKGSFMGSDAFFPMPDNIELAAKHGIKAIAQPGGSIKDEDVVKACDKLGIAMVFTGKRHFRH